MVVAVETALAARRHRVEMAVARLETLVQRRAAEVRHRIMDLRRAATPLLGQIEAAAKLVADAPVRLERLLAVRIAERRAKLEGVHRLLKSLDPAAVLARGYAIVWKNGKPVANVAAVDVGDRLRVQLASGSLDATVADTSATPQPPLL
jgi:exodeoxyribonuclease VII large subunit